MKRLFIVGVLGEYFNENKEGVCITRYPGTLGERTISIYKSSDP